MSKEAAACELAWGTLGTPVGEISVACSAAGVARVRFGPPPAAADREQARLDAAGARSGQAARSPGQAGRPSGQAAGPAGQAGGRSGQAGPSDQAGPSGQAGDHLDAALARLAEYFAGQRHAFDLPVDWSGMSAAQRQVLPVLLASAAYGETVTYGELARRAGLADGGTVPAARVVGQVMGSNPCAIIVPCHRVVAGDGLGGYGGGTGVEIKRWLLIFEGALPPTLDWDPAGPGVN